MATNTFDVGSVVVDKVVDGPGAEQWGAGPFEVTLECTFDGESIEIPGGAARELVPDEPVTYTGLPLGADCVVTETDDGGADSTAVSGVDGGEPGAVSVGAEPAAVTVTNTFEPTPTPTDDAGTQGDDGSASTDDGDDLPRTGADVARLLGIAVLLLLVGAAALLVAHRRNRV